jgi:hypothetical protein
LSSNAILGEFHFGVGPPRAEEPLYSFNVFAFDNYQPASIAAAALCWPGTSLLHPPEPGWEDWQAAWETDGRLILLDKMYVFDDGGWGMLRVTCDCRLDDVRGLWGALLREHPGVWMSAASERLYSPDSFQPAPPVLDPRWLTSNVGDLSRTIYAERAFERLPILADALMDAGCDNEDILAHCRSEGPHVRSCWVVDLLLGKQLAGRPNLAAAPVRGREAAEQYNSPRPVVPSIRRQQSHCGECGCEPS